jgi:hypothetical protein
VSVEGIGIASIVWLILMHVIAGAMGGYLAGRLRTKWTDLHTDEVFFRDTAHGFLVWAVGLVITAVLRLAHVYFPTTSIVSLLYVTTDGHSAEVAIVGSEGMVGVALPTPVSATRW